MEQRKILESLAKNVFAGMNSKDFEQLRFDLSENVVFDFPGTKPIEGSRRVIIFLNTLMRKYKDLTFKISDILVDSKGSKACVIWTNFGTDLKGNEYNNNGITYIKFSGEKISFLSDYFKDTSFTLSE